MVVSGDVSLGWEGGCRRSHSPSEITNSAVTMWGKAQPACAQFGFSLPKTLPCQRSPNIDADFAFFLRPRDLDINWEGDTQTHTGRYTNTHTSMCTWRNVTATHILICRRFRVSDGRVVTFTQACEFLQIYFFCRLHREMGKPDMFMERPYLVLSLWKYEEVIQLPPLTYPSSAASGISAHFERHLLSRAVSDFHATIRLCPRLCDTFARVCSDTSG